MFIYLLIKNQSEYMEKDKYIKTIAYRNEHVREFMGQNIYILDTTLTISMIYIFKKKKKKSDHNHRVEDPSTEHA